MKCDEHDLNHLTDNIYRKHEVIIMQCPKCRTFVVDARSDDFEGDFIGGWIDDNLTSAIIEAVKAIDKHIQDKVLLPF